MMKAKDGKIAGWGLHATFSLGLVGIMIALGACQKAQDTFENGSSEQKPATSSVDPKGQRPSGEPTVVLSYDYGLNIALKSGLVICKNGRISIDIKSDVSFDVKGVSELNCVSAKLDLNKIIKPLLGVFTQVGASTKIGLKENVVYISKLPNFSGLEFNPPVPTFFVPTIGGDNTKFQGLSRVVTTSANFKQNPLNITSVSGTSTLTVVDVDKPITTSDGKTYSRNVHWKLTTDWEKRGLVPFLTLFDVTWSTNPLDLLGLTAEITINPSYLPVYRVALDSQVLAGVEELAKLADLNVDLTLVISITR